MSKESVTVIDRIRVLEVRGQAVVLDSDLATIYGAETKQFNRAVRRMPRVSRETLPFKLSIRSLQA